MTQDNSVLVLPPPYPESQSELWARRDFSFIPRDKAENDLSRKQVIPYILVISGTSVLGYQRSNSSGEERLARRTSLGWGGHIERIDGGNCADPHLATLVENCASREIYEELRFGPPLRRIYLGIINDDSEPVGEFHLGYVEAWIYDHEIALKASSHHDKNTASRVFWIAQEDLLDQPEIETWSLIAVQLVKAMKDEVFPNVETPISLDPWSR